MQWLNVKTRWLLAGGVVVSGAGYAAMLTQTAAPSTGVSPSEIRAIASRSQGHALPEVSLTGAAPVTPVGGIKMFQPVASPAPRRSGSAAVVPFTGLRVPILPGNLGGGGARLTAPAPQRPAPPPAPPAPVDPVAGIALMGVTHQNDEDVAWLVNLNNQERELVSVGESGFGFTVREIGPDSVQLARGGEDYVIRLGDKQIPVNEAPPAVASASTGGANAGGGEGRRGRRQWGGGQASAQGGGFGGRNRGNRGNWGARSFAGNTSGGQPQSFSSGGSSDSGGNRGSRQTGVQRRGGGGGNFGGGNFGRMNGFQNGNNGGTPNQFAAGTSGSTSNPQTARRRGGQLTGGADPIEAPQAITNPQTQRRLGTSGAGTAFGQSSNGQGQNRTQGQNRIQGQNRGGGFQR